MNTKICSLLVILAIISLVPLTDAQISIGEKARQELVEISVSQDGKVHVKHIIRASNLPVDLELISGTVSNISVLNNQGEEELFSTNADNTMLLLQPSSEKLIIEYELEDALSKIDDVWTWDFRYLEKTSFIIPEGVDLIFVNERPVFLDDRKGFACHGCQMILEYSIDEPKNIEYVNWENMKFAVEVKTLAEISDFNFSQHSKEISFRINNENRFVTTVVPLELLWGPYEVFLNDEKTYFHEYVNNGTHVWISMKPDTTGKITIIGTTVIPEFPIFAPMAIGFLMVMIIPLVRKFSLH